MKKAAVFFTLLVALVSCHDSPKTEEPSSPDANQPINWNNEVIYHVMPRSFFDSNGDRHGDLNGFIEKLDYLEDLGVTTILFTPLYASGFYHNYFPTDYEQIDPEYGTLEDYLRFVEAVHARGMKFLMDMETQYAQSGHVWFDDSYKNPASPYADFIYYADSLNEYPEQIFLESRSPLYDFKAWPDTTHNIVFLDLNNERVRQYMRDFYAHWVDPNGDGDLSDGVDGFRIDHIMDDLDDKGLFTNLYAEFWQPIFDHCRSINPHLLVLGEQADWGSTGWDMVERSGADAAFNFHLRFAMAGEEEAKDMYKAGETPRVGPDPARIHAAVKQTRDLFGDDHYCVTFLENHDTDRWATVINREEPILRLGAALNLLLPGIPSVHYGQELGVTGQPGDWGFDANHIPVREAFPWQTDVDAKGIAAFYKDTGPWWDSSYFNQPLINEIAFSTQKKDPNSLWNLYRNLIRLRKEHPALRTGDYQPLGEEIPNLLAFQRALGADTVMVFANCSPDSLTYDPGWPGSKGYSRLIHPGGYYPLEGREPNLDQQEYPDLLRPWEYVIWIR